MGDTSSPTSSRWPSSYIVMTQANIECVLSIAYTVYILSQADSYLPQTTVEVLHIHISECLMF